MQNQIKVPKEQETLENMDAMNYEMADAMVEKRRVAEWFDHLNPREATNQTFTDHFTEEYPNAIGKYINDSGEPYSVLKDEDLDSEDQEVTILSNHGLFSLTPGEKPHPQIAGILNGVKFGYLIFTPYFDKDDGDKLKAEFTYKVSGDKVDIGNYNLTSRTFTEMDENDVNALEAKVIECENKNLAKKKETKPEDSNPDNEELVDTSLESEE